MSHFKTMKMMVTAGLHGTLHECRKRRKERLRIVRAPILLTVPTWRTLIVGFK